MIQNLKDQVFLGNNITAYLIAAGIFLGGFILVKIFQFFILRHLKKLAEKTATTLDDFIIDLVKRIFVPLSYFGVFYLSVNTLKLDELVKKSIVVAGMAVLTIFAARFAVLIIN